MTAETDLAYIAGLLDGEAYIGVKRSKHKGRTTPGYHARIQVRMVDEGAIRFLATTLGGSYYHEKPHSRTGRPLYCYQVSDLKAETILRAVLPYMRVKRASAEVVLSLRDLQSDSQAHRTKVTGYRDFPNRHGAVRRVANRTLSDEYVARCDAIYARCKELNAVGV